MTRRAESGRTSVGAAAGMVVVLAALAVIVALFAVGPASKSHHSATTPRADAAVSRATRDSFSCPSGRGSTVSSWVGNSFGGANGEWIQPGIQGLWVATDGTAYGESIFNEGARELRGYRDGRPFGGYTYQHANDLPNGGVAVTGDSSFVYAAVRFGQTAGVMRYYPNLTPAPFAGGSSPEGAVLAVNHRYEYLTALAAGDGRLYVADPNSYTNQTTTAPPENSVIRVYDSSNLGAGEQMSFRAPRARGLAIDGAGDIWVLEQADSSHHPQIVRYSPQGHPTGQVVTGISDPTSIAVDTTGGGVGRLLVTDDGFDQNVKIFSGLASTPRLAGTFGVKGGVNAGPVAGRIGPDRLNGPAAIGVDGAGNIYIVSDGTPSVAVQGVGEGENLQAYQPDGHLLWQVYGQKYNTTATGLDTATGVDLYSAFDHFTLNLAKPLGKQWTRVGWTLNQYRYPYDPRIDGWGAGQLPTNPVVRNLDGHKFLFMGNGMADSIEIYRFDPPSETAIPSGSINTYRAAGSREPGEYIWRDTNGDGSPYGNVAKEYTYPGTKANVNVTGWWVDSRGDVWQTTTSDGIREFEFSGLDSVGNPIYSYRRLRTFATPQPFNDPRRLVYDPTTDTLVLSGYTTTHPTPSWDDYDYKFAGSELAVYDHFTATARPIPAWVRPVPYTETASDAAHKPITLTAAGDYIFVGYFTGADNRLNSDVQIFNARTGAAAGVLSPGATIGGRSGNTDMEDGTSAYQTRGGGYLIFDEDDLYAKTIMYEWCPRS